ncbi:S9 family peptidase [Pseudobacter ginsenosidimutans]|uniref:Acyl-peptide hydrolase n=1 Tax=Pseudobacter ginsenosidimutans TaxID=661488 RepID=A0A4Q7N6C0_9BACT|nr:prolyl oligopeptidase family serine peptidase [Pseudobacter ginsenosidimutans]QEC45114.1 S9 family peptidase [Pseudobacter ginsenosidimutans]RZS76609.1 dipeptidyl aminopeptidase/acylaminoacyl peptidase [Pseudobacter ginsenosidimutans]
MKKLFVSIAAALSIFSFTSVSAQSLTLESITRYPFISELSAASRGSRIAFAVNREGQRNIYVAEGPQFVPRKLTAYDKDDGQELSGITLTPDGSRVIFVRGADHGAFDETIPRNPSSSAQPPAIRLYSIPFSGGIPKLLSEGDEAVVSPDGKQVAFIKDRQAWIVPADGSKPATALFYDKGHTGGLQWSPDGSRIAFISSRGDHSFIGIFLNTDSPIQWISPAFARDASPRWSPDGKRLVFVRRPASGGAPDSLTVDSYQPWALQVADLSSGKIIQLWKSPETLRASVPASHGRYNLLWAAGNRIVFLSTHDGWPHLYSLPADGGEPLLLTPGNFIIEHIKLSPDGQWLTGSANTGPDTADYERRHIIRVPVNRPEMELITRGDGIETFPLITGNGKHLVYLSATAQRPTLPAVISFAERKQQLLGENLIPKGFPANQLVTPKPVRFKAPDGQTVYGQIFLPEKISGKSAAVLFIHGGPERQMLLGWHYGDYYANTYALNQYLVSRGFIVLSVNYRLGIGYGYEFQHPARSWIYGASEYQDIKAAGEWLAAHPLVDASKIGVYGGSYGGFLTALALGRDSKLFAAGVDIHGEHNLTVFGPDITRQEQAPDLALARQLIWESSPIAWLDHWTSPVLLIHGDDDGNVEFHQSIDLARRFEKRGFAFESLVIPNETHHWMKYSNLLKVDEAVAEFLERKLLKP